MPSFSFSVPSSCISMSAFTYLLYSASGSATSRTFKAARICFFVSISTFLFCVSFSDELTKASKNATMTTMTEA